jgi:hypothetical protein
LDITGPPSVPRQFVVKPGGMGDVLVDSDDSDELNNARVADSDSDDDGYNVGDFGDNNNSGKLKV